MTRRCLFSCLLLVGVSLVSANAREGKTATAGHETADKAAAYYHYSLGHLYAELAGAYANKNDFLDKAIDNYRKAIEADPSATFLSDELSDLYVQAGRLREAVEDAEAALKRNPRDINARRILGRIYMRMIGDTQQRRISEKMLKKAIEQYEKIVEQVPNDKQIWLLLGRLYKFNHDSVKSETAYKKVLELDAGNEDALVGLATVYSDLGDYSRAAEMLRQVTGKDPGIRTLTFLATIYEQMHEYKLAAETYRRALALSPQNSNLKLALAEDLLQADQAPEALKVFEEVAATDPKNYRSLLRVSQIYQQEYKFDKAVEALKRAKDLAPDNLEILYQEVTLLDAVGKTDEAITALRKILDSTAKTSYSTGEKANRSVFLERLGLMYRATDQFDKAVATFTELGELNPDLGARVAAQIADTWRQAKQYQRAAKIIESASRQYPDDRMVAIVRATILADLGDSEAAITAAKKLADQKKDRESYLTLAQIYEKTKHYAEMAKTLDKADKLSSSDEDRATVLFMRGAMYERQKRFDEAERSFREVLKLNPDNAAAMNYLGFMFADRNVRLREALKLISKALEFEPRNGAYLDSLGWVYYRMGKLEEADRYLTEAVRKVSTDPVVHDHLGDVRYSQGKLKDAIAHWRASLEEWKTGSVAEKDLLEPEKVREKIEGAEVRLAKESVSPNPARQP